MEWNTVLDPLLLEVDAAARPVVAKVHREDDEVA